MSAPKVKTPFTPKQIRELAKRFAEVPSRLEELAKEAEHVGLPEVSLFAGKAVNTHLAGLKMWLLTVKHEIDAQSLTRDIAANRQKEIDVAEEDGRNPRGRPRKGK